MSLCFFDRASCAHVTQPLSWLWCCLASGHWHRHCHGKVRCSLHGFYVFALGDEYMSPHICSTKHYRIIVSIRTTSKTWISGTSFYINLHRKFVVYLRRGMTVFTPGDDEQQLSHGVYDAYTKRTADMPNMLHSTRIETDVSKAVNWGESSNSFESCQAFGSFCKFLHIS